MSHSKLICHLGFPITTRTLAVQLARSQPALYQPILHAARHASRQELSDVRGAFDELIRRPLESLPADHHPVCIVVDAVDGGNAEVAK